MKRTPLRRAGFMARKTPIRKKRSAPRRGPLRDPEYLAWLRERKCCISGAGIPSGPIDACHGPVNGRGSKGPDNEAIPMTRELHREQHRIGWPAFELKYGIDRARTAAAHYAAYLIDREHYAAAS